MGNKLRDEDLKLNIIVNGNDAMKELGDLEKVTRQLTERNKELRSEKEKLIRAGKQDSDQFRAVTKEITDNNKVLNTNKDRMTALRKEIGLAGLTMKQLRAEQLRLKNLTDSSTYGTDQWVKYNTQLKAVEAQMAVVRGGAARMNIASAFQSIPGPVSAAVSSVTTFGKSLWALAANPIGAIIGAIVVSLMLLYKAFTSTDSGANAMAGTLKAIGNVMDILIDRAMSYYKMLWSLVTFDWEGVKTNAVDAFGGIGKAIKDATNAGWDYAHVMDSIGDREAAAQIRMAKLRSEIELLKNQSKDVNRTTKEKSDLIDQAMNKEIELFGIEKGFMKERNVAETNNLASKINNSKMSMAQKQAQLEQWLTTDDKELESMMEKDAAFAEFVNKNEEGFQALQKMKAEEFDKDAEFQTETRRLQRSAASEKKALIDEQIQNNKEASENAIKKFEDDNAKEMALITKRHLEGKTSEDQYNDELLNQEIKFLTEKMTVYKKGSKEYEEAFNQSLEKQVQAEKRIKDLLISAEKELAEAKIENLVDGIEKEKAQENQRWSDEKRGLEKQLLDKKDLSDQEAALNAAINATIEEKERLHQDKLRKLKEASKIGDLENLVTAATPVDPNFATLEQQQSFFDARQALIEAQYAKEKQLAGKNQTALKAAERRYNSQMYQLKSDQIDAEYALNEKRIGLAQNYVSMLSGVVDEESALGKALFLFNQGLAVAEVWVNIAKANAKAIAASPLTFGQPWVAANTVQGGIQTGIILAQTIAKFSKKGKKDGGFTGPASSDDQPMGVYHANEWFANAKAVRNPEVKQFLDIFDYYQRTGQISKLNTKMILANLPVQQMYVGGYSSKNTSSSGSGSTVPSTIPTSGGMSDTQLDRLNAVLDRLDSKDFSIAIETYERKKDNWKKITNGGLK